MNKSFIQQLILASVFISFSNLQVQAQKPGSFSNISVDGINDHVLIPDDTSLNPRNEITVEAWIRADTFGKNIFDNSVFCKHGWSSGNKGYVLRVGAGGGVSFNLSGRAAGGAWQEANTTSAVLKTKQWYHLAGTFDGDSVNVYVNGQLVATKLYSGQIDISSGLNAKIGELAYGSGRNFKGAIDEVRVWSKALSDSMLRAYMCQKISSAHPYYNNLVGYWNMDEYTGTSAVDRSPYGNDGTLRNGTSWDESLVPLGDTSIVAFGNSAITLGSPEKDFLKVNASFSTPGWAHVYLINDTTTNGANPNSHVKLDSTHYFGIYTTNSSAKITVSLDYGDHKINGTNDECGIDLLFKQAGGGGEWAGKNADFYSTGDSLVLSGASSGEYMLGVYPMDSTTALNTQTGDPWFCSNDGVWLIASGNSSFSYQWYVDDSVLPNDTMSSLWVMAEGKYKVDIERSASCKIQSNEMTIVKKQAPSASLNPIKSVCEDSDTLKLSGGSPVGGHFLFRGTINDGFVLPSEIGPGKYDVVYEYIDTNGCSDRDTQTLEIWNLPKVYINNGIKICNNLDTVPLIQGRPVGGDYTGTGIVDNNFIPSKVSRLAGRYPFTYGFTDTNGCYNEVNDSIVVLQYNKATIFPIPDQCEKYTPVTVSYYPTGGQLSGPGVSGNQFSPETTGPGTFELKYIYTNAVGCTDTDTQTVVVYKNTPLTWNYSITTCLNNEKILPDEGSPKGGFFSGKGLSDSTYFRPLNAGTGIHDIYYNYIDSNGCQNRISSKATVMDTTKLATTGLGKICSNVRLTLNHATPSGGEYYGPGVSNGELLPWNIDTGDVRVFYNYTSSGCTSTIAVNGYIIPPVQLQINFPGPICGDRDPVRLNALPKGGTFSGKGVISDLFAPQFAGAGVHFITYAYTDGYGCVALDGDSIEVVDIPNATTLPYSSICENEQEFVPGFGDPVAGYGSYYRYQKDSIRSIDPRILGDGTYKIYYILFSVAGCKDSAYTDLVIHPQPPKPIITQTGNTLRSSASEGNQWYDLQGPLPGENNRDLEAPAEGDYFVIVTTDSGCTAISDTFEFFYTGIYESTHNYISLFPNPSNGEVQINGLNSIDEINVYSIYGKLLISIDKPVNNRIHLGSLNNGQYIVVLISEGMEYSAMLRIIK